ncbi:MAG: NUDIX hydrolase [Candidatus Limnocylindria bacterium]
MGSNGRTRIAAYALCRDDAGRILLCHIAPSVGVGDVWTLPGGGIEFGEAPAAAALRELAEETGLHGEIVRLLDVTDRLFESGQAEPLHAIRIVYRVRIVGGALRDETDGSTDAAGWFTNDEAARLRLGELSRTMLAWPEDD